MSEWWVGRQGSNPVGPVTTDTLIRGILEKKVPEDSLVCRVGEQHWQHIAQVDDLWEQVHPEQFLTNVTKQPWFNEKGTSQPPSSPPVETEIDDESTRIFAVPILPMRTVDSSPSNPLPARAAFPPAAPASPSTAGAVAARSAAPQVNPPPAASPSPAYAPSPKPIISPPRFGLDKSPPGVAKPQGAIGPALPSAPQPAAALPNRPGIAVPQHAEPDSVPLSATRPRLPNEPPQNSRPWSQTRPDAPAAQQHAARPEAPAPQPFAGKPAIQQPPIQPRPPNVAPPLADARAPRTTVEPEEDTVTVITQSAASEAKANVQAFEHPLAPPPTPPNPPAPRPTIREVEPSDLFDEDFEAPPPKPVVASHVVPGADHGSVAPRPAAGTPAPPSVIISHPPPSMADIVLSHAVASIPEETRPALRSMRPAGTIQVTIGTLVIGALTLVVLVLLVVLLLH